MSAELSSAMMASTLRSCWSSGSSGMFWFVSPQSTNVMYWFVEIYDPGEKVPNSGIEILTGFVCAVQLANEFGILDTSASASLRSDRMSLTKLTSMPVVLVELRSRRAPLNRVDEVPMMKLNDDRSETARQLGRTFAHDS